MSTDFKLTDYLECPGPRLKQFQATHPYDLFPLAQSQPSFFAYNLVSPRRTIRQLRNAPDSALRVFYYQMLKVCFELELEHSRPVLEHFKRRVFRSDFKIGQVSAMDRKALTDLQSKKVLAQFLVMLQKEVCPDCEAMINRYPVIDAILVQTLKNMLINLSSIERIFGGLADEFNLAMTLIGDCYRFEDSDIFCYAPADYDYLYLTFMDSSFIQPPDNTYDIGFTLQPIEQRSGSESGTKNQSSITPLIYSATNISIDQCMPKNTASPRRPSNKSSLNSLKDVKDFMDGLGRVDQVEEGGETTRDRSFQRIRKELDDRAKGTAKTVSVGITPLDPYTPASLQYSPYTQYTYQPKQYPAYIPQQPQYPQQGDYYEDFTKTFLLESIDQPFRTKIRTIKNNIRGMRKPVAVLNPALATYW